MYIQNEGIKQCEREADAPAGWVTNTVLIRDGDKIIKLNVPDDNENE